MSVENLTELFPLDRPVAFFDIEATGSDPFYDRIVEISILKIESNGTRKIITERINPGIRIPIEAINIHRIRNEDVKNCPSFREIAPKILDILKDSDLAGYNIVEYDLKIIAKEFERAGIEFSLNQRRIVDAFKIFQRNERRDLSAAYKFYCGKQLKGAHGAEPDILATYEVFLAQLQKYNDLPKNMAGLHEYCNAQDDRFVDAERKFYWRDGQAYFNFGKYKSKALEQITHEDPNYIDWIIQKSEFSQEVIDICWKALRGMFPSRE